VDSRCGGGSAVPFLVPFEVRGSRHYLAAVLLLLSCFFLFYAVNYRTLIIRMTPKALALRFGVFSWTVPWDTVAHWHRDDTPMWRVGGAGIHFTKIRRRYRVFFNFLGHPRLVLELSKPRGFVSDVVFSTRRPAELLDAVAARAGSRDGVAPARQGRVSNLEHGQHARRWRERRPGPVDL